MVIANSIASVSRYSGLVFVLCALALALCVLFGAAAAPVSVADAVCQLVALPLLLIALWRLTQRDSKLRPQHLFCMAIFAVPLFQLIPLPPQIWTSLPLRDIAVAALGLADQSPGWRPLSLLPQSTWVAFLSLIPPVAIFLTVQDLNDRQRRALIGLLIGLAVLASFLALLQGARGAQGFLQAIGLYSGADASGFFANRNHSAALLYCAIPFVAAFIIIHLESVPPGMRLSGDSQNLITVLAGFVVLVVLLSAIIITRSRAGLVLTMLALFGVAALLASRPAQGVASAKKLLWAAVTLVVVFSLQYALARVLERFDADPLQDMRLAFSRNTWTAIVALMPFGGGVGSFVPVYQYFEPASDTIIDTFVNRAHNDYLEILLETGVIGGLLILAWAVWFFRQCVALWRSGGAGRASNAQDSENVVLSRAASIAVLLLALHSFVDYPLRTAGMASVFALACGLLLPPRSSAQQDADLELDVEESSRKAPAEPSPSRHKTQASAAAAASSASAEWKWPQPAADKPAAQTASPNAGSWRDRMEPESVRPATAASPGQPWGADVKWPDAWVKPDGKPDNKGPEGNV